MYVYDLLLLYFTKHSCHLMTLFPFVYCLGEIEFAIGSLSGTNLLPGSSATFSATYTATAGSASTPTDSASISFDWTANSASNQFSFDVEGNMVPTEVAEIEVYDGSIQLFDGISMVDFGVM